MDRKCFPDTELRPGDHPCRGLGPKVIDGRRAIEGPVAWRRFHGIDGLPNGRMQLEAGYVIIRHVALCVLTVLNVALGVLVCAEAGHGLGTPSWPIEGLAFFLPELYPVRSGIQDTVDDGRCAGLGTPCRLCIAIGDDRHHSDGTI